MTISTSFCSLRGRGLEMVSGLQSPERLVSIIAKLASRLLCPDVLSRLQHSRIRRDTTPILRGKYGFVMHQCIHGRVGCMVSLHDQHALPSPCLCISFCRSHTEQVVLTVRFLSIRPMLVLKPRHSELARQHCPSSRSHSARSESIQLSGRQL